MKQVSIDAISSHKFSLDHFNVVTEVLGLKHEFEFQGRKITVGVPLAPKPGALVDQTSRPTVYCYLRRREDNARLEYEVSQIALEVSVDCPLSLPADVIGKNPNQFDLIPAKRQKELDELLRAQIEVAQEAFRYWLNVIRWQSRKPFIGEPRVTLADHSLGSSDLREISSHQRFWTENPTIRAVMRRAITYEQWRSAQEELFRSESLPTWFEFLFDGRQRINNRDFSVAILMLAMALEGVVRFIAFHRIKMDVEPAVIEIIDLANMRAILTRLKKLSFWNDDWKKAADLGSFHEVMDIRDRIMHKGDATKLSQERLIKYYTCVEQFCYYAFEQFRRSA